MTTLTRQTFFGKVTSLLFNMLSRLVKVLPRSKCLLISWLQSPSAVILEPKIINSSTVSPVYPSICHELVGPDAMIFVFWMLSFKPTFSLSSFTFIKKLVSSSSIVCYSQINPFVWLKITSVLLFKVNTSEPIQKSESSLMHMIISVTYITKKI